MSWNRGYYTDSVYTSFCFRETSPAWLDYSALLQGFRATRKEGERFQYLELGCGTGYGLCLLASMYPEGRFVGIDFHPDHIGQALRLKETLDLNNVEFMDVDLIEVDKRGWIESDQRDQNSYDYIASHGVLSWVSTEVQNALLRVSERHLRHGGIFYCSYNTNPGWLSASIFREVAELDRQHDKKGDPYYLYLEAAARLSRLIGTVDMPSPLGASHPGLFTLVEGLPKQKKSYLLQEYAMETWEPFWCSKVHKRCKENRLSYIGTATLSEIGHYFLPDAIRKSLAEESSSYNRSTLEDIVTNKSFRRDLFVKGGHRLLAHESRAIIESLRAKALDLEPNRSYDFQTSFGIIKADAEAYQQVEAAVDSLSPTILELCQALGRDLGEILPMVTILMQAGRVYIEREGLSENWRDVNSETSLKVIDLIAAGHPFAQIPVMATGMAASLSTVEAIMYKGISAGISGDFLIALTLTGIQEIGHTLTDLDGKPLGSEKEAVNLLKRIEAGLLEYRLPTLSRLGAL